MTLPTQTVTLSDVFTRYAYNKIGGRKYKDNKYKRRPLLRLLRERKLEGDGGPNIVHPVNLGTAFHGSSLGRNQTFSIEGDVNETWSRWTWSTIYESCFVSWWDIREARGNQFKMEGILDSRINETGENLEDNVLEMLCQDSKADSDDVNSLKELVKATGEVGGLNPATAGQTTWASQVEDTIDWSAAGIARSRQGIQKVEDNKGTIDVIILPDTMFNETCETGDALVQIHQDATTRNGTKIADLGLKVPFILDTPVIHDPRWNSNQTATGLGLDLNGAHLIVDPMWDMYMYPFKEMAHHGRLGQASVQVSVCQLTMSSRRTQLLLSTLS